MDALFLVRPISLTIFGQNEERDRMWKCTCAPVEPLLAAGVGLRLGVSPRGGRKLVVKILSDSAGFRRTARRIWRPFLSGGRSLFRSVLGTIWMVFWTERLSTKSRLERLNRDERRGAPSVRNLDPTMRIENRPHGPVLAFERWARGDCWYRCLGS